MGSWQSHDWPKLKLRPAQAAGRGRPPEGLLNYGFEWFESLKCGIQRVSIKYFFIDYVLYLTFTTCFRSIWNDDFEICNIHDSR